MRKALLYNVNLRTWSASGWFRLLHASDMVCVLHLNFLRVSAQWIDRGKPHCGRIITFKWTAWLLLRIGYMYRLWNISNNVSSAVCLIMPKWRIIFYLKLRKNVHNSFKDEITNGGENSLILNDVLLRNWAILLKFDHVNRMHSWHRTSIKIFE